MTKNDTVQNSIDNCVIILENDPLLKGSIRFNCLTERVDIVKDVGWKRSSPALVDLDLNHLEYYLEKNYGITKEKKIQAAVNIIANRNQYHPIQDYLNRLTWDGEKRIRSVLHHFLGAAIDDYTEAIMQLFLLGAISRVFHPGCKFEYMLCLVGSQGAGKSSFFRLLALKDEWYSDDLKRIDDDNVYRKLQGHWIIEMSEMIATASARSIEEIKSFLSRAKETYKVPYETFPADRLRQCVFAGTTNTMDFLPLDRSGNRRFLPVMVHPEQSESHILDDEAASRAYMDQLWAEAMTVYRKGNFCLRLPAELANQLTELQRIFMPEDTKAGMIQAFLDGFPGRQVCSKLLYREALEHGFEEPNQREIRDINDIMNNSVEGWIPFSNPRHFQGYGRQRGWERDNAEPATGGKKYENFEMIPEEEAQQMELPFEDLP